MAMNKDFGAFELKEKIGAGGMASVYLAVQKSLARPVVLKILYPHLAEDEKLVQRFEREARAAAMMRHENIIQVIDCGRYDDVAYIAMEFVEGMDLKKWLEAHGTPPVEMAILMLRDVCRGLEHAHTHRIVHRDIKPANIMLTPDGTIKIMDFGLARSGSETSTQMTMVGSVLGTPAYMSPEQATGEVVDERSDIFSAGVVAYELLGGQRPFMGDSYSTVLRSILTVEPQELSEFNPLVPEGVARIVRGMLQKDVGKRAQTISSVREALEDEIEKLGLHRGKDLLREYATDPEGVSEKWRQKRMSRHMDLGIHYENMGLGKIDDALLEFRRVLFLDPTNAVAKDHLKKLEHERSSVVQPPAAAPPAPAKPPADDRTVVMSPGEAAATSKPAPSAPPSPTPAPPAMDDRTVVMSPGQAAATPAPPKPGPPSPPAAPPTPPAKPKPTEKPADKPAPKPAPKPATAPAPKPAGGATGGGKKSGLPVPMLIGVGGLLIAGIVVVALLMGRHPTPPADNTAPADTSTAVVAPPVTPQSSPSPPPVTPPVDTVKVTPLDAARTSFDAADYVATVKSLKQAIADKALPSKDRRAARELLARTYVREKNLTAATAAFAALLKDYPAYVPDPALTPDEQGALETARQNIANVQKPATPTTEPPPPPTGGGTATVTIHVSPFAESFLVDGKAQPQSNQKNFTATVPAGHHVFTLKHPSLGTKEWSLDLAAGDKQDLTHDFAKLSGSVSVTAEPTWGEIYLDGVRIGHTTPWEITPVPAGKHEIALVRDGWNIDGGAQTVDVKAGETKQVKFKLKQKK